MLENCEADTECFVRPFQNLTRVTFTPNGRGNYWLTKKLDVDCDIDLHKCGFNHILVQLNYVCKYTREYNEHNTTSTSIQ